MLIFLLLASSPVPAHSTSNHQSPLPPPTINRHLFLSFISLSMLSLALSHAICPSGVFPGCIDRNVIQDHGVPDGGPDEVFEGVLAQYLLTIHNVIVVNLSLGPSEACDAHAGLGVKASSHSAGPDLQASCSC